MAKLHELLAVQGSTTGQASKCRADLTETFTKRRHHFESRKKTFTPNEEEGGGQVAVEEQQDIQTTVTKEIDWLSKKMAAAVDVAYQVDVANTVAKADIETESGDILAKGVPATTLLQLEKRITEWKDLIAAIPTLDPAKGFVPDTDRGTGYYQARPVLKIRTRKDIKPLVLFPATEKHPAQTQVIDVNTPIGTIMEQEWSALITPALKSELLDNVEILLRAVSKARSKANALEIETQKNKIGTDLLSFVFKPLTGA